MNNLSALRERVEKAEGPDRELDALIVELDSKFADYTAVYSTAEAWVLVNKHDEKLTRMWCPDYTASIDAAVALIERKLPDFIARESGFDRRESSDLRGYACITTKVQNYSGFAHSEPLALIAALLNALENAPALRREQRP